MPCMKRAPLTGWAWSRRLRSTGGGPHDLDQALTIIQAVGAPEAEAVAERLMPSVGDGPGQ